MCSFTKAIPIAAVWSGITRFWIVETYLIHRINISHTLKNIKIDDFTVHASK